MKGNFSVVCSFKHEHLWERLGNFLLLLSSEKLRIKFNWWKTLEMSSSGMLKCTGSILSIVCITRAFSVAYYVKWKFSYNFNRSKRELLKCLHFMSSGKISMNQRWTRVSLSGSCKRWLRTKLRFLFELWVKIFFKLFRIKELGPNR